MRTMPYGRPFTGKDDPRINLKGRPKIGQSIAELAREFMREEVEVDERPIDPATGKRKGKKILTKVQRKRLFLQAIWARAIRGSEPAAKLLWNYCDGLPPFRGVISTPDAGEGEPDFSVLSDEELAQVVTSIYKARGAVFTPVGGNGQNGKAAGGNGHNGS